MTNQTTNRPHARAWITRIASCITISSVHQWVSGAAAGTVFVLILHLATATWGLSQPVCAALLISCGIGFFVSRQSFGDWLHSDTTQQAIIMVLAIIAVLSATLNGLTDSLFDTLGQSSLESRIVTAGWLTILMIPSIALPMLFIGWLAITRVKQSERYGLPLLIIQMVCGTVVSLFLLGPWIGLQFAAVSFSLLSILTAIAAWYWPSGTSSSSDAIASNRSPLRESSSWPLWCRVPAAACCGIIAACSVRMVAQLMITAEWVFFVEISSLAVGFAIGWVLWQSKWQMTLFAAEKSLIAAAVFSLLIAAVFPNLVDLSLRTNAHISSETLLILIRSTIIGCLLAPIGILFAATLASNASMKSSKLSSLFWTVAACGFLVTRGLLMNVIGVSGSILLAAGIVAIPAFTILIQRSLQTRAWSPGSRLMQVVSITSLAVIVGGPFLVQRYQPEVANRLLFSTKVFNGYRAGYSQAELLAIDDGRIDAVIESEFGTLVDQRQRAVQSQLRLNGTPKSIASLNSRICPQFAGELLQAVVPLVLHQAPHDVLVLGLGGGVPSKAALEFPIQSLTSVDADRRLAQLIARRSNSADDASWWNDPRHSTIAADIPLAARALKKQFDVVISNADYSAQHHVAATSTRDFYQHAARRLKSDGLFCQRLRISDFGDKPIRMTASTLQSVFRHVIAFDSAPGELLFLCSMNNQPIEEGWRDRVESPQVKRSLAQIGWDWTVLTNTAYFSHEQLAEIANGKVNDVANGYAALTFPNEMMRWGAKWQEVGHLLADRSTRLLNQLADQASIDDALSRVSDVTMLRKLVTNHPDEPWVYRKVVKDRLLDEPRSQVVPVKGEGLKRVRHPDDKHRLEYFEALGKSLSRKSPSPQDIQRVAEYEKPYDPLVSYFIHNELARLYQRAGNEYSELELQHRMHAIFYGSVNDRSVRDIHRSIELVLEIGPTTLDETARWDYLNSLVEVLKLRWETRGRVNALSKGIMLNDIEQSQKTLELATTEMESIALAAGISRTATAARLKVLEMNLQRPLKVYQAKLLTLSKP